MAFDLGAFDLDGTVLRRNLRITQDTVAALQKLRERGMRLVVATGRRFESAREQAQRLGFTGRDPVICYGGSMVRRMNGELFIPSCNKSIASPTCFDSTLLSSLISDTSGR